MLSFIDTNPTEIQGRAFVDSTAPIVTEEAKQIKQRDSIRMATYYEGLHKDYGVTYQ
jgi:hypothetical protein